MQGVRDAMRPFRRQFLAVGLLVMAGFLAGSVPSWVRWSGRVTDVLREVLPGPSASAVLDSVLFLGLPAAETPSPEGWWDALRIIASQGPKLMVVDLPWEGEAWGSRASVQGLEAFLGEVNRSARPEHGVLFAVRRAAVGTDWTEVNAMEGPHTNLAKVLAGYGRVAALGVVNVPELEQGPRPRWVELVGGHAVRPLGTVAANRVDRRTRAAGAYRLHWYGDGPASAWPTGEWRRDGTGDWKVWRGGAEAVPEAALRDRVVYVGAIPAEAGATDWKPLHATLCLNLVRRDGATAFPQGMVLLWAVLFGAGTGAWWVKQSTSRAAVVAGAYLAGLAALALVLLAVRGLDFPWLAAGGGQALAAVGVTLLPYRSVFLSYRRSDGRHVVLALARELRARGVETYVEIDHAATGDLRQVLASAIRHHGNFVVVLTPDVIRRWTPGRDWMEFELGEALREGRPVIPLFVDDFENVWRQSLEASESLRASRLAGLIDGNLRALFRTEFASASMEALIRRLRRVRRRRFAAAEVLGGAGEAVPAGVTGGGSS